MIPGFVNINDYTYSLPEEKIALYPLPNRDQSKLLYYCKKGIEHHNFHDLPLLLPRKCILFFNQTRVIPARLLFHKEPADPRLTLKSPAGRGARIEIFLLEPVSPSSRLPEAFKAQGTATWKCTIGNLRRWNHGTILTKQLGDISVSAQIEAAREGKVRFTWSPSERTFAEVLEMAGEIPLPPYIHRAPVAADWDRYQTIFSQVKGAVAAPTAGLHFTSEVLDAIRSRDITIDYLTLHVGAGTFMPVKVKNALDHKMHSEQIIIGRENIVHLLSGKPIIAVGTTALRTLESLYWYGALLLKNPSAPFSVESLQPYPDRPLPSSRDALQAVLQLMDNQGLDELTGRTSIYILPGYQFKLCDGLITNFHQPGSTLLLLIAAFVGPDWKNIYQEALGNSYRVLSYGDSSFLVRDNSLIL